MVFFFLCVGCLAIFLFLSNPLFLISIFVSVPSLFLFVSVSRNEPDSLWTGRRRHDHHSILYVRQPLAFVYDAVFDDISDLRRYWPSFSSWAMSLFEEWAPILSVAATRDPDAVCPRYALRGVALESPLDGIPDADDLSIL